jgi:hypothetical protein
MKSLSLFFDFRFPGRKEEENYVQIVSTGAIGEWPLLADKNVCAMKNTLKNVRNEPIDPLGWKPS